MVAQYVGTNNYAGLNARVFFLFLYITLYVTLEIFLKLLAKV